MGENHFDGVPVGRTNLVVTQKANVKQGDPWRSKNGKFEKSGLYLERPDKQYFTIVFPSKLSYVHLHTLSL